VLQKTLLTAGIGESDLVLRLGNLDDMLTAVERRYATSKLAYLPSPELGVRLRITARAPDHESACTSLDRLEHRLRTALGSYVYGENEERLESVIGRMLADRGMTIAVAESCTGGLLGDRITNVPGSSSYMKGGIIAYENSVKVNLLDVDPLILDSCGAVSQEVACAMAVSVREKLDTSIGIALTGIAGPAGGTPDKPVGTVWIGYADTRGVLSKQLQLGPDRLVNKMYATTVAMNMIRLQLIENFT
jgi:nicotinamide-nucleotide amidase